MCGIAGLSWSDPKLIKQMTRCLAHRGPDGQGTFVDDQVSLGHRRLSIMDLTTAAAQPMKYRHYSLIFNGEIFNFGEIKTQLQKKGHCFTSTGDTEVILHAYAEWGSRCINRFNGQWALAIYDSKHKRIFLSRDRFGIKPLYYQLIHGQLAFASEIKGLLKTKTDRKLDPQALEAYLYQKYIPHPLTIYRDIKQLAPGQNAVFDLKKKTFGLNSYYQLEKEIDQHKNIPESERLDSVLELLKDAVKLRLIADVPVGTFLSGGLDSSLLTALAKQTQSELHTFSVSFAAKSYDESSYARIVADHLDTRHHVPTLKVDDHLLEKVLSQLDQPFGDASVIPTYLLAQTTRKHVTVALSGDGADEVFGGYDTYCAHQLASLIPAPLISLVKPTAGFLPVSRSKVTQLFMLQRFIQRYHPQTTVRHFNFMAGLTDFEITQLLDREVTQIVDTSFHSNQQSGLTQVQVLDLDNYLPGDILVKADTASMLNSLEVRLPYLDYRLVPLLLSLPERFRINGFVTKSLLKELAGTYLPRSIIHRPKRGFTVPIADYINQSQLLREYAFAESQYDHGLFDYSYVSQLLHQHQVGRRDVVRQLWLIAIFNYWWRHH